MEMGFIGLGGMGEPIARNLMKAGHALRVYNRTGSRAEALASKGATNHAQAGVPVPRRRQS
jgi:3-hydroxyisobutyrate dehydrogenase-like beta-hydroxyacid dehydrogenase